VKPNVNVTGMSNRGLIRIQDCGAAGHVAFISHILSAGLMEMPRVECHSLPTNAM